MAGWEFARPDSTRVLAFVYSATVSLRVEESCVGINPALSLDDLKKALTSPPAWIGERPDWLKTKWPEQPIQRRSDLELYGLTASKALLAVGSKIPDGTSVEMADALSNLLSLSHALQENEATYEAWNANVTIETNGHMEWGYGRLAREGLPLPLPNEEFGGRSPFEVFLQNQLRIDIQQRIEGYYIAHHENVSAFQN